jgi:primosomal protein N' (replication factor Y) (superfamily II helicase)
VVPAIPSFAVDRGFWYAIPEHLAPVVAIGTIVRVPLSGRKVRGYVVELAGHRDGLKEIKAASSSRQVFDRRLLEGLEWAAHHYVAPLAVLLERSAPPNLPLDPTAPEPHPKTLDVGDDVGSKMIARAASGGRKPAAAVIGPWQHMQWLSGFCPVIGSGRSAMVICATAAETARVSEAATATGFDVVRVAGDSAKVATRAWSDAQTAPRLVIGTPRISTWNVPSLGVAVVIEEGRRAMKDRQTPTVHVREMMMTRSRLEGFSMVFIGPTPSVETLSVGAETGMSGSRAWPLVEVVDRREDPPGSGSLAERSIAALRATVQRSGRSFVFTHRTTSESSVRCSSCRRVRLCTRCGSNLGREESCRRCGHLGGPCAHCGANTFEVMATPPERLAAEINRRLGAAMADVHPTDKLIDVGTERDLADLPPADLAVAVDADGLLLGHDYRAGEEALRILARVAGSLSVGSGRRMIVQTSMPDSELITTLRRGDPRRYLESQLGERARLGLPPAVEMMAIETRGEFLVDELDRQIRELGTHTVLGPADSSGGSRWLVQGKLGRMKTDLRPVVQRWRDSGVTVRVDSDPIDL